MPNESTEELRALVERYKVCWNEYPLWFAAPNQTRVKIGFEIDLWGTHDHPAHPAAAGCEQCRPVRAALEKIASAVIPADHRRTRAEILPNDPSLHMAAQRHRRKDVLLEIHLIHRNAAVDAPVDDCEEQCRREVEAKLKELGAAAGDWETGRHRAASKLTLDFM